MLAEYRSSNRRWYRKKGVLKNFVNVTGEFLCWSLFLIKLIKKRLYHKCFPLTFSKILTTPILKNSSDQLFLGTLREKLLNSTSRLFYFNECLWTFQIFFCGRYIPVWYIPKNHELCIFIIYNSAGRERTKQFSTTIKINWTKSNFYNITSLAYSYK